MRKLIVFAGLACALVACSSGSSKSDALIGAAMEKIFMNITGDDELVNQANDNLLLDQVRELVEYSSSQRDPKVPAPGQDIVRFGVVGRWMSPTELSQFDQTFPEGQGSIGTTFRASNLSLQADWYAFGYVEFDGDVPINVSSKILQYAWVLDRDGDPVNNWQGVNPFDLDFFNGTDKWLQLVKAANQTAELTMSDIDGMDIQAVESRARAIVCENALVFMVPMSEFDERNFYPSARFTSFDNITGDFGFNSGQWSGDDAPAGRTYDDLYNLDWSVTARLAPVVRFDVRYAATKKDFELDLGLSLSASWNIELAGDFDEGGVENGHAQDHVFDWDSIGGGFAGHGLIAQDLQAGWLAPEVFNPSTANGQFSEYVRIPGDVGVKFETRPADQHTPGNIQFDASIPYLSGANPLKGQIRGSILSEADFGMKLTELENDAEVKVLTAPSLFVYSGQTGVIQHKNRTATIDNFTAPVRGVAENADSQIQMGDTGITLILTPKLVNDRIELDLRIGNGATFRTTQDITVDGATMGVNLPVIEAHDIHAGLTLDHSQTVLIGGLLRDGEMIVGQGVPYLRDIPLLNKLLATPRDIDDDEKVMIFVTATLVGYGN